MKSDRSILITIAWLLAAVCLLCCLSEGLPRHGMDHACSGEDCLVCLCVSLREMLSAIAIVLAGLHFTVCFLRAYIHPGSSLVSPRLWTPVCLKVKLSN